MTVYNSEKEKNYRPGICRCLALIIMQKRVKNNDSAPIHSYVKDGWSWRGYVTGTRASPFVWQHRR